MTEPRNDDRAQARREAAALLGVDIERLSPADNLRVDMVSALRLVIDSEQASVLDGGSADLGKLNVAVQSLIALLPGRELPEPASNREDPREAMWATYKQMRDRGAQFGIGYDGLKLTVERLQAELVSKDAEIAALRAGAPAPGSATPPAPGDGSGMSSYRPAAPAPDPAARVPVLGDLVGVVSDPSPADYVEPDGSIRSTPRGRGKDWGPV